MLTREIHPMPEDIRKLLKDRGLYDRYEARPPYQQNDYLGWIAQARREGTRHKRIEQMLDELEVGGLYMKMRWTG
ncbi:YdeI/OmpD-associated family protein [Asticcacaulis sp.]|uniref:YdeI/OmpD-associated family protein n=1 Tax=Asticcacaulis sp. TaxID=1872648 RepID=UPI002C06E18F|nr:YdeI/OmpD-associated family protein [Asticcacaulis sp.]HTM83048.1 YdeI/OmpD-associated family protein [Asticcacaulis sp.]